MLVAREVGKFMLKGKAQPIVVHLLGRPAIANSENDGPAQFYLKLCDEYKRTPPPETWDGVIALDEK